MSWGKGIALTMAAFMAMIIFMVYKSTQQEISLVTKDYYETSLAFNDVQQYRSNYLALDQGAAISVLQQEGILSVTLPAFFDGKAVSGKVHLYKPSDSKADRKIELVQPFQYDVKTLANGLWKVKVDWTSEGKGYMFEEAIILNR